MQCPACGGKVIETELDGYISSLCCDTPFLIIHNWELFEALPSDLRQIVIDQDKAERDAIEARAIEIERLAEEYREPERKWSEFIQRERRRGARSFSMPH